MTSTSASRAEQVVRFMSADPGGVKVVSLADPQTWNLYAYTTNNPTTLTDSTGLYTNGSDATRPAVQPPPPAQQQLSSQSIQAIQQAAKQYGYNAAAFESAITAAATKSGINPNVLVGLGYKESSINPAAPHGGLFQIQPGRAKDLGISPKDIGSAAVQIPKVAGALAGAIRTFHGNVDLGIASWTLGVAGTQRLFSSGGMQSVRGALLDRGHPGYGTVGANYIDIVKRFLGP